MHVWGRRGIRIKAVNAELGGEKVEVVNWYPRQDARIASVISPSPVERVLIGDGGKSALVIVADKFLSLAIGKEGQNARLVAKLSGCRIDIKPLSAFPELPMTEADRGINEGENGEGEVAAMTTNDVVEGIVAQARTRGYFALDEYSGLRLSQSDLAELMGRLRHYRIPVGSPLERLDEGSAKKIIGALRRGTVPNADLLAFSVGRDALREQVRSDLDEVSRAGARVRFMNADLGQGKTHALYLLRETAFAAGFAVSLVTLDSGSCPLYELLKVYHEVLWNLRTAEERSRPALATILDRWLDAAHQRGHAGAQQIVRDLPEDLKKALVAYHSAMNPVLPDYQVRDLVLSYLSAERVARPDLRRLSIHGPITEVNALESLGLMARLFRHLGYRGLCILFDEAEAIHSFSRGVHQADAYHNLHRMVTESRDFPHCYFVYATTPTFFDTYGSFWSEESLVRPEDILELERLSLSDLRLLARKVVAVHEKASAWQAPRKVLKAVEDALTASPPDRVGDGIRQLVSVLDEYRTL